ncbi:MAG: FliI/YscN family ATPase [Deltaproteobacteria bacterium]|nr:FliI/YscN family ATPase [Deltaproteobacteria bacterium]
MIPISEISSTIDWKPRLLCIGTVCAIKGALVSARIPLAALGDLCWIERRSKLPLPAQVVSFYEDLCCLAAFDSLEGITPGAKVRGSGGAPYAATNGDPRGQVLDALGGPLRPASIGCPDPLEPLRMVLHAAPPNPLERRPITSQLVTGIRTIDALCPLGYGQRMGIFASAGVGKSTLLGMIARHAQVDVTVIALVGERGREVQDFIEHGLGPAGLARSVVVVATSDESPLRRLLAPKTATAIAEHYRDQGLRVLLLIDSLTRTARAIREVELSAGEIPVRQGYTAGVYSELPKLLERAGTNSCGSITALYTILTSGEEEHDALADEIKSILDGHLVLSSALARQGMRPAIDPLHSVSRLQEKFLDQRQLSQASTIQNLLSRLRRDREILLLGGTPDPELKAALQLEPDLMQLLTQAPNESSPLHETTHRLAAIVARFHSLRGVAVTEQS